VTRMAQTQLDLGRDFSGTALRLASAGDPKSPHLLLIHGHASRIEEYEDLAALLAPRFRVHMVDLPGCGYSEKPNVPYSLPYFEEVLERVLDRLEIGTMVQRTFVAGGGLGGNLALRLAYRDAAGGRDRIARVAAWSVAGWGATRPLLALGSRALVAAPRCLFLAVAKAQLGQQYSAAWSQRGAMIVAGMEYRREVFMREFQAAYAAIAAEQVGTSMLAHAAEIRAPVLLLAGELDRGSLDIRAAVENLARAMGLAPVVVGGSGYAIANERPDELASRLLSFFQPD
jgi:pimeloyl-ACP methyl ester carboxylesterase